MRPYIGDGQETTFYIKAEPGKYPACRFSGRPMAYHQTAAVLHQTEVDKSHSNSIFAAAIAERIVGASYEDGGIWKPLDDHSGNKLPISAATIGGLQFDLFCKLRDIVLGLASADSDPDSGQTAKTPGDNEKN